MAIDYADLFGRIGKALFAGDAILDACDTARAELQDFVQEVADDGTLAEIEAVEGIDTQLDAYKAAAAALVENAVAIPVRQLVVLEVQAHLQQPDNEPLTAIRALIADMEGENESILESDVGISIGTYVTANTLDATIRSTVLRPDGLESQYVIQEVLFATVAAAAVGTGVTWTINGTPPPANGVLSSDYPGGSGTSTSITSHEPDSGENLVENGSFEEADENLPEIPEGWIPGVATVGTTLKLSDVEEQTVIISGTPASGYYVLHFTDRNSKTQSTVPLAHNAGESDVEAALQALDGLEDISVATTGSSPNYTHTITFNGVPNPGQLTSTEVFNTGSIAHATSTAGSAQVVHGGRALIFNGNGAELTDIYTRVELEPNTVYFLNFYVSYGSNPNAGEFTIGIYDGIGGSALTDDQGTAHTMTLAESAITATPTAAGFAFATPRDLPPVTYLRFKLTTALQSSATVFIDSVCLVPGTQLYPGGPYVAAFSGKNQLVTGDTALVTVTQDYEGELGHWLDRIFGLKEAGLVIPYAASSSETISDSVIA